MGGKRATSTSSVSIPPEVLARYNAVNTRAETAASTPYEAFGKTASDFVAQMNAQQGAGISDINATAGSYQPYMTQATSATQTGMGPAYEGIDRYMSPYVKNVADTTGAYMRQQAEQAQSGALGNAISSGAFGGDRAGIAAANLQQQNQMGYGKTMADILNQGYTQALGASQADLARQLQGGSQLAGLGAQSQQLGLQGAQAKIAAGTMQQQTEQAGKDAMIEEFMRAKGYPFQTAQFLANIAMGTGAATGSTTTTQTPRNWLGFASGGGVSGYADGGGVSGPRTYTQEGIGGVGYVPAGDLPVGQLMVADVPEDNSGDKTAEMIQTIASVMGAKRGGVIDARHGYAPGGVSTHPTVWNPITRKYEMAPEATGVVAPATPDVDRAPPAPTTGGVVAPATPAAPATGVVAPVTRRPEPTPTGWDTFRPQVSQRESGGDPNALLNFSQREGGPFAGVNVTDMTVNQAIEFAKPGGPYANYSREQVGRVATPMGEYQIVGATLRQARDDMGLTGDEVMTPELQEQIAQHLYNNYGETPWAASAPKDGLGGADLNTQISTMGDGVAAGVKPYEDRNFIGKFFHNRDGSLNSNAVMALIGGLAKGAEAQTISPLGGILSGLGGGMETYKELLKQTPEVIAANIENTNALQTSFMRAKELGYPGTIEEFAKSQGWQNSPFNNASEVGAQRVPPYMGVAPVDIYGSGSSVPIPITHIDGTTHSVPAGSTYGYLMLRRDLLTSTAGLQFPGAAEQIAAIDQKLADIRNNQGYVVAADGTSVLDPSFAENQDASISRETKNVLGQQIIEQLPERSDMYQQNTSSFDRIAQAYGTIGSSGMSTGPLTQVFKDVGTTMSQLGLPFNNNATDAWAAMDIIGKELAGELTRQGVNLSDNARDYMNGSLPNITLQKAAIAEILAAKEALLEREGNTLEAINSAGANPSAMYDADFTGRQQPVEWEDKLEKYKKLLGIDDEAAAPAPGDIADGSTLQFSDGSNRVTGTWNSNGPNGPAYYGPDGAYLGTGQ